MRHSILALAPFVAAVFGQEPESSAAPAVVPVISGSVTASSTYTYSNTMTNFLSLTNSYGVVTGMPTLSNPGTPVAATSQPTLNTDVGAAASIPAGLPTGINTVYRGGSNISTSYFLVSVGSSTTVVVQSSTSSASATGGSGSGSEQTGASGSAGQSATGTQSAGASSSSSAADAAKIASGAVLGLGAAIVALL